MATVACSLNGLPIHAYGQETAERKTRSTNGKILVLVRMAGGNDGLNMVIPVDRYAELSAARADILIPQNEVLGLNGNLTTALHPGMTAMKNMFDNGKLNIIQGVSYPNPSYSHFRATDIYSSASDASLFINSGWIGRFIDQQFPGAPNAYPNASFLDPLSIEIGSMASSILMGNQGLNGFTIADIDNFYNIVNGTVDPAPNTRGGNELTYVRYIIQQTQAYTSRIQTAALAGANQATYPTNNRLADQLKIVAKLISGGLETPVYIVTIDGFDTHDTQVDASDHKLGWHANLLTELSNAIGAFQEDLELQSLDNNVVGLTFSEFGRRIISNGSHGTDHGEAAPMFVFGTQVNQSVIGNSPVLPAAATVYDSVPMQHDFRQIYSTILTDWFGLSQLAVNSIMNGSSYQWLPIFQSTPLSISLKEFKVIEHNCQAILKWESNTEENLDRYEVMYSRNNIDFQTIEKVSAHGRTSTYQLAHTPEEGIAFYKLGMIDIEGQKIESEIVTLQMNCNKPDINVFPNPADTVLHIQCQGLKGLVMFALINSEGRMVRHQVNNNNKMQLDLINLPNGIYSLVMNNADGHKEVFQVLIQH